MLTQKTYQLKILKDFKGCVYKKTQLKKILLDNQELED